MGGVGQNKGGIAVSLSVWDTEFCFVNSHLAAHQDKVNSRNAMYRSIVRGIRLDTYNMDILTGHHHVFWMGDLNYRIAFGRQRSSPTDEEFAAVVSSLTISEVYHPVGASIFPRDPGLISPHLVSIGPNVL